MAKKPKSRSKKKVGILTGGGDCPGLNGVIRGIVRKCEYEGKFSCVGILEGWRGVMERNTMPLGVDAVAGIHHRGGTILRTSRTNPFKDEGTAKKAIANVKKLGLHALIAIGGDDTLGAAYKLSQNKINVVGVPKTIDNDLSGTEVTFGFDTAINIAMEAIDRLHTTAESHNRVIVVEVMGRHAGWIALESGLAAGADLIAIPEVPLSIDYICDVLTKRHAGGKRFSIVVVSEGAKIMMPGNMALSEVLKDGSVDQFGHVRLGGIGDALAKLIDDKTGLETRATVLGHIQRGGHPTAFDRILGTRFGIAAADLVHKGDFGKMVALKADKVVPISLLAGVKKLKTVPPEMYEMAKVFFG